MFYCQVLVSLLMYIYIYIAYTEDGYLEASSQRPAKTWISELAVHYINSHSNQTSIFAFGMQTKQHLLLESSVMIIEFVFSCFFFICCHLFSPYESYLSDSDAGLR